MCAVDAARTKLAAYAPSTLSIELDVDLSDYVVMAVDLEDRRIWWPPVRPGPTSVVEMPQHNHDMLLLAAR